MFEEIVQKQGWNDETLLSLVLRFVSEKDLDTELGDFLLGIAKDENDESAAEEDE